MIKRSIKEIVKIFRTNQAFDINSAKTAQELGITSRPLFQRFIFYNNLSTQDWKPGVLALLIQDGVIQTTPDNRLYLSESRLQSSIYKIYS
jgi:hypothetical protein